MLQNIKELLFNDKFIPTESLSSMGLMESLKKKKKAIPLEQRKFL